MQSLQRTVFKTLAILCALFLMTQPVLAVSEQRRNIERNPLYDKNAELSCAAPTASGGTPATNTTAGGGLYYVGDSIGEGLKAAGLESQLTAKGYTPKVNADQSRSITGKGTNTRTSGIEAVQGDIEFIKTANVVVIELGTNPENNFGANLDNMLQIITSANPAARIYYVDVAASPAAAGRIGAAATNKVIYQHAATAGTQVISRFKIYYPNGDPQTYSGADAPAHPFDSLGVHATSGQDYQLLNDAILAGIGQSAPASSGSSSCSCLAVGGAAGGSTGTLSGSDNQQKAFNYFVSKGFSPQQAGGIVGNLIAESGVNPKRVQSTKTPEGDKDNITVNDRTGYGIAQWTSAGRQQGLVDFARARGLQIEGDLPLQLDYLMKELTENYTDVYNGLKSATDLAAASSVFMTKFERPKDQSATAQAKRAAMGQQVLELYGGGAVANPTANNSGAGCPSGAGLGGLAAGFVGFPLQTTKARMTELNGGQFKNGVMGQGGHPYAAHDIMADPGTPVVAILGGKVVGVSTDKCPGRLVSIYDEAQGVTVAYLHMSIAQTIVQVGNDITPGQIIGYVGQPSEGCGTPHLHIDANTTNRRIGCKRESCSAENQALFQAGSDKIGLPQGLFNSYQKLP